MKNYILNKIRRIKQHHQYLNIKSLIYYLKKKKEKKNLIQYKCVACYIQRYHAQILENS